MLPPDLMDPGMGKTLTLIHDALERRLRGNWTRTGNAWDYHEGKPFETSIKDTTRGIWLNFDSMNGNEREAPYQGDYFISQWTITLVYTDEGTDPEGFSAMSTLPLIGDIIKVLRETLSDIGMDGTADYASVPQVNNDMFKLTGSGRTVATTSITFKIHHPLQPIRCP